MSFDSIVTSTKTFDERSKGVYVATDVNFGSPENELRLRANVNKKSPSVGIIRYKQIDYTSGSTTSRIGASVNLSITMPPAGFSTSDLDIMVAEIAEFVSSANLSRLFQGEA